MKKFVILLAGFVSLAVSAQDIYKVEDVSGSDLNGTARYVGMGGAMSALGADISVMNTNPAGIGMYRKSDVALTASVTAQKDAERFYDVKRARVSFDQAGVVAAFPFRGEKLQYFNIGFNYQKRRNFKNYMDVQARTKGGMSQTWQMADLAYGYDLETEDGQLCTTPLTVGGFNSYLLDKPTDFDTYRDYLPTDADAYRYTKIRWGGVQEYDFNLSANLSDRVYVGFTGSVSRVNMHSGLLYTETADGYNEPYKLRSEEALTGTGIDAKFGVIFRPLESSPARIGVSIKTPTLYNLTQENYFYIYSPYTITDENGISAYADDEYRTGAYDYNVVTPWTFNLSAATTIGNYLALDAEYEVAPYGGSKIKWPNRGYNPEDLSVGESDKALCEEIKYFMKPVSTLRIGVEGRLISRLFLRGGYNFVSSPFKKDAYLNLFADSPAYNYSCSTDYVNLGVTHRLTLGLGYRGKHFYADLAYQYQTQDADVYAFHVPEEGSELNRLQGQHLNLVRQNAMLTFGYKF